MKISKLKVHVLILFLALGGARAMGQEEIGDLEPKHAAALRAFLAKNKAYGFLPETKFDADSLKRAREIFGLEGAPYYLAGDFNGDRRGDFAVILSRRGKPKRGGGGAGTALEFDHPLAVAVFNGTAAGGFRLALVKHVNSPPVSFLRRTEGSQKLLTFTTVDLAADFMFKPRGRAYTVVYPDEP